MYESAGRDQISNFPADFRQLSIAWILTITRSKSAATAHGALLSKHLQLLLVPNRLTLVNEYVKELKDQINQ